LRDAVVILAGLSVLFAGCSSDGNGTDENGASGEIVVQVSGEPEETAVYRAVASDFEDAHPDVAVRLVEIAEKDDHLTRLASSFASGKPPDVFLVNFREYSQFVVRGAVEPVGPLLEEREVDLNAYFEQPIEAFTFQDELQCMPQNISSLVVYYNEDLFEAADLEPPSEGWSWDGFRDTAVALTRGDVRGLGIEPAIIRIAPFVWANGGDIVDDLHAPTRFTLDTPEAIEAIEYVTSLVREDQVVPTEEEIAAQDLETRFVNGKLGMLLSSRRDTPPFREVSGLRWNVGPLPTGKEQAGILHSDAYCISAGTDTDAAADFVAFATGREGQTITALGGRTVPSLRSVARSGAFLDPSRPPSRSKVFLDGIPYIRRTPVISTWPEIEDLAEEIFTRIFYEEDYTIEQGITELNEQAGPLFEEAAQG
jgi:multiple sugar transport system substrate-binding protein